MVQGAAVAMENDQEATVAEEVTTPKRTFKRICVFCGSSSGFKDVFSNVALSLGRELVSRNVDLVYGGGSIGLMGHVAQTVRAGGGHVIGYNHAPRSEPVKFSYTPLATGVSRSQLATCESCVHHIESSSNRMLDGSQGNSQGAYGQRGNACGQTVGELVTVVDMHQRKAEMGRLADAFMALPGDYGTLEELLEVITWSQLGIHENPVGLLNVEGYYNPLLALFDKALEEGFLGFSARNIVVSAPTASELLNKTEAYTPMHDWTTPKLHWEVAPCLV